MIAVSKKVSLLAAAVAVIALFAVALPAEPVSAQAVGPFEWAPVGQPIAGEPGVDSQVGSAVAVNATGTRIVVGGSANDSAAKVQVFDWNGSSWIQAGGDVGSDLPFVSGTAMQLALSADGMRVAVGTPLANLQGKQGQPEPGLVRVFEWDGSTWDQMGTDIAPTATEGWFGSDVALSADGGRLVAGAEASDGPGQMRAFDWNGTSWVQVGAAIVGRTDGDQFGHAVAMSADGSRVAGGSFREGGYGSVFAWNGSSWQQVGADISGLNQDDVFGSSVSLSGDGSRFASTSSSSSNPNVLGSEIRVFQWTGSTWDQLGQSILGPLTSFGPAQRVSLSTDGTRVAGGWPTDGTDQFSGSVRTYAFVGATWLPLANTVDGAAIGDELGYAVALSGNGARLIAGSPQSVSGPTKPGFARVYQYGPTCGGKAITIDMNQAGFTGTGTPGDDVILGTPGDDTIDAGAGDDTICSGDGRDRIRGGGGDDVVFGGQGIDRIWGDSGSDTIEGEGGSDRIRAGSGDDIVRAGSGADRVWGGPGNDTILGMGGQDRIWGQDGHDVIQGNWQSDRIWGGPGADTLRGAQGKDKIYGEAGDDLLFGGNNTDFLDGGDGNDRADGQAGKDNPLVPDVSGCIAEITISC